MDAAYKKALSRCKTLSPAEAAELHRRMHGGDRAARDRLIESVLKLVYRIAMKYASVRNSAEELAAEGNTHAIRAVDAWNPEKARLSTLVSSYVANGIKSYLWLQGHNGIYIPLQTARMIRNQDDSEPLTERRRRELGNAKAALAISCRSLPCHPRKAIENSTLRIRGTIQSRAGSVWRISTNSCIIMPRR